MRIISLDASTTTIALSVFDFTSIDDVELVHYEYYKPNKKIDLFFRLNEVRNYIIENIKKYKPDQVILEDIILFMKGHSTAATVSSLAVLNRTVGLAILNELDKLPILLNVMKIRHSIKVGKILPPKEDIPELVASILKIKFPWEFDKKAKPKVENYDIADSMAVGLAYIKDIEKITKSLLNEEKSKSKVKKSKKK